MLRYLGYFRFEFFGQGLSTLMKDRESSRTAEQAVRDAEALITQLKTLDEVQSVFSKVAEGMQIHEVKLDFYRNNGKLGVDPKVSNPSTGYEINWKDPDQEGYYSRDKEFVAEFQISGRNFNYGTVKYTFMDGRSSLKVQEEVLLERVHDALSAFATRLRKTNLEV